jgi:serine/threonine protein kinase
MADRTIYESDEIPSGADQFDAEGHSLQPGDVLRDRFEVIRLLGKGGMSRVFLAVDRLRKEAGDPESLVAIKLLNKELADHPEALVILQREASKMQRLAHPNIASVYDLDRYQGLLYLVMEYVQGRDLRQLIAEHPSGMPLRAASSIIRGMAAGLSYAHSREVIHLDFKPSNIFVLAAGGVKIFDFGIARRTGQSEASLILSAATPLFQPRSSCWKHQSRSPRRRLLVFGDGV